MAGSSAEMNDSLYRLAVMVGTILPVIFGLSTFMKSYKQLRTDNHNSSNSGIVTKFFDFFLLGNQQVPEPKSKSDKKEVEKSSRGHYGSLLFCIVGLQGSYLLWGVLQEKLMTTEYDGERFTSSSLLVLLNRLMAILFAFVVICIRDQPPHRAPALEYSFASATNVLSAFCQYEALIYVSFPMQTVTKACKVIPTMIMGTFVQGKTFTVHDYFGAALISIGVAAFSQLKSGNELSLPDIQNLSSLDPEHVVGVTLLVGYLTFDSFTSNWQSKLFADYKISSFQAMLGISSFSSIISMFTLLQSGELWPSVEFLQQHPGCLKEVLAMSLASAVGQLFIFHTISEHGPVVFTIISVTRQLLSIILSGMLFGHVIPTKAWFAVLVTFSGIFYRIVAKSMISRKEKSS